MPRKRTIVKLAAALLAAALILPFAVNVNRFSAQIGRALEAGLGRPVRARGVRLKLFSGLGFDLLEVTVADDPAFGIEPLARMPTLRATVRLRSLWTGRLSFSSLVLVEPSINLARNAEGHWNVEPLLARAAATSRAMAAPPYLELQDARINFKSGDLKSVFFLSDVDAALYSTGAASAAPRLNLRFRGSPARTDRTLTDVGELRVEGWFGETPARLRFQVNLTDAYLADLMVLASGAERGVHGVVNVNALVEGDQAHPRVSGALRLRDLHRAGVRLPEEDSSFDLRFDAVLNGPARRLELQQVRAQLLAGSLEVSGVVSNLPEHPEARLSARFAGVRAGRLLVPLQHLLPRLSPGLRLGGSVDGELVLHAPPFRVEGFVEARNLEFQGADLPRLRTSVARVEMDGEALRLEPVMLEMERGRPLSVSANWNWRTGAGRFSAAGRDLALQNVSRLQRAAGLVLAPNALVLPGEGRLTFELGGELAAGAPPRLTGWGQLSRARWGSAGAPVLVHAARLDFLGDELRAGRIVASWAGSTITGTVRVPSRPGAAINADLQADEIDTGVVGAALRPSGGRLPLIFARLRRDEDSGEAAGSEGQAPPLRAEGRLAVRRLRARRLQLRALETGFHLTGRRLQLDQARATFAGGVWTGSGELDFTSGVPAYTLNGRIRDLDLAELAALSPRLEGLASGHASGTLLLFSSGWTAAEALDNLSMRVRLQGNQLVLRNIDLEAAARVSGREEAPATAPGSTAGAAPARGTTARRFTADLSVARRLVRLQQVRLVLPAATFDASGAVGFDHAANIRVLAVDENRVAGAALHNFRLVGPLAVPEARAPEEIRKTASASN